MRRIPGTDSPPAGARTRRRGAAARPVFVDASGRRQKRVRLLGKLLVVPALGYVGLLISTVLGGPTVHTPLLPTPPGSHHAGPRGGGSGSGAGEAAGHGAGGSAGGTGAASVPPSATAAHASPSPGAPATPTAHPTASPHGQSTHAAKATPPGAGHRATPTRKP